MRRMAMRFEPYWGTEHQCGRCGKAVQRYVFGQSPDQQLLVESGGPAAMHRCPALPEEGGHQICEGICGRQYMRYDDGRPGLEVDNVTVHVCPEVVLMPRTQAPARVEGRILDRARANQKDIGWVPIPNDVA